MPAQARRRFTLLDAMVLVAATAAVLGCFHWFDFREFYASHFSFIRDAWSKNPSTRFALGRIGHLVPYLLWPFQLFLTAWTIAVFALRWVPPRPRRRRIARQPGTVACGMISLVLVVEFGLSFVHQLGLRERTPFAWATIQNTALLMASGDAFRYLTPLAGWAAAASWLVLAASGRWRPEPDWIDRTGRVLGWTWIAMIPFYAWVIVTRL